MKPLTKTNNSELFVKGNTVYKFSRQFIREALICKMVGPHPYLVRYEPEIFCGKLAIKSPLYPCSLDQIMNASDVWKRLLAQIGSALAYLHSLDIVHRDIKPANIFCTSKKLSECDFLLGDLGSAVIRRGSGALNTDVDPCSYSAPAHLSVEDRDWWSLGLILQRLGSRVEPESLPKWTWPVPLETSLSLMRYPEVETYLLGVHEFDQIEQVRAFMHRNFALCPQLPLLFKIAVEFYTCMDVTEIKCDHLDLVKAVMLM